MRTIIAIAFNTLRESVRDKIFYSLLFFGIAMLGFSTILGNLTIGQPIKIIQDFGLGAISIFGTLVAVFVGIQLIHKEIEKKTIYHILSKPVARWQFIIGKYTGLTFTLFILTGTMVISLFALCYSYTGNIPWSLFSAIVPIIFETQLILAVAVLFSSFSTPFLSSIFTVSIFIIGHLTGDLLHLLEKTDNEGLKSLSRFLYYSLPNLESLNFKAEVVHGIAIPLEKLFLSISYATCYTFGILCLSILIFNARDLR